MFYCEGASIDVMGSRDRKKISHAWSDFSEQGFSFGFSDLRDVFTRLANFDNVSVILSELIKRSCSYLSECFQLGNVVEEAISNFVFHVGILTYF